MNKIIIPSFIAFLNLCSAFLIFINRGDIKIAYFNLITAVLIATWIGLRKDDDLKDSGKSPENPFKNSVKTKSK